MKRLRKSKGFLLGLAMGLFISTITFTANAESITKQLTAYYNNIKLVVNGNEVTPKDGNGKVVEPFIVDGTTYLPVRAVAEALGQAVSWDGKANTVYIGENKTTGQPTVWLKDMDTLIGSFRTSGTVKDNLGNSYDNFLYDTSSNGDYDVTYALNGQYSKFTGGLILREEYKSTPYTHRLVVYLDDKVAYTSEDIKAGSFPTEFSIDTRGAIRMKLVWEYLSNGNYYAGRFTYNANGTYGNLHSSYCTAIVNAGLWK